MAGADGDSATRILALRIACVIGISDSVVALMTSVITRPESSSIVVGIIWVAGWSLLFVRVRQLAVVLDRHPWLLPLAAALLVWPAVLDGGYPGNLATQPIWAVVVAAAALSWRWVLVTGASLVLAKNAVFVAAGNGWLLFAADAPREARTAILLPLVLVPLSIALATALRKVARAIEPVPAAPSSNGGPVRSLTSAEAEVVSLLADGLTPKEIATARGTSLETVRTQIKRAKRATHARTLDELVATAGRSA